MELDVDILIPAALEGVINNSNVERIKARYIIEVANGPVESDADRILDDKGIMVVPDVLANAGGVTVSYFEWVQNRQGFPWTLDEVHAKLQEIMQRAFEDVWAIASNEKMNLRNVAYTPAMRRLGEAIEAHGTRDYFSK